MDMNANVSGGYLRVQLAAALACRLKIVDQEVIKLLLLQ